MARELTATEVSRRLAWLRAEYVPLSAAEARERVVPPARSESFARAVSRRLEELRALSDLSTHLHRARRR